MGKTLVAYFSASGITALVAKRLAEAIGADLFEINPKIPYTKADLNWMDKTSRSTIEMKDKNCRPQIEAVIDIAPFDTVFIGFPIWWYREPSIIDTFMESTDFSGKNVIPFCTSGSSGLGESANNMQALAPTAKISDGARFKSNVSSDELREWAQKQLL